MLAPAVREVRLCYLTDHKKSRNGETKTGKSCNICFTGAFHVRLRRLGFTRNLEIVFTRRQGRYVVVLRKKRRGGVCITPCDLKSMPYKIRQRWFAKRPCGWKRFGMMNPERIRADGSEIVLVLKPHGEWAPAPSNQQQQKEGLKDLGSIASDLREAVQNIDDGVLANSIIDEIIDRGLADSTWRENNPKAYKDLLDYRADMVGSVRSVLHRQLGYRR